MIHDSHSERGNKDSTLLTGGFCSYEGLWSALHKGPREPKSLHREPDAPAEEAPRVPLVLEQNTDLGARGREEGGCPRPPSPPPGPGLRNTEPAWLWEEGEGEGEEEEPEEGEEGGWFPALVLKAHPSTANAGCSIRRQHPMMFMKVVCKSFELYNPRNVTQHSSHCPDKGERAPLKTASSRARGPRRRRDLPRERSEAQPRPPPPPRPPKGAPAQRPRHPAGLVRFCPGPKSARPPGAQRDGGARGEVPAAAQFQVAFCSPGAPGRPVPSRLHIHRCLGRKHSFRSPCARPGSARAAGLLAAPARGSSRAQGRGAGAPGEGPAVLASRPPAAPGSPPGAQGLPHLGPPAPVAEPPGAGRCDQGPGLCSRDFAPAPRASGPSDASRCRRGSGPGPRSSPRRPPRSPRRPGAGEGPRAPPSPPPTRASRQPGPAAPAVGDKPALRRGLGAAPAGHRSPPGHTLQALSCLVKPLRGHVQGGSTVLGAGGWGGRRTGTEREKEHRLASRVCIPRAGPAGTGPTTCRAPKHHVMRLGEEAVVLATERQNLRVGRT